ncbi:MAG: hypothetical protein IT364_00600 [Candidatus Hydrogenedentes bacterium]|nr:hypothetical protein [Candidatus Hydrogenedentota bacterium]
MASNNVPERGVPLPIRAADAIIWRRTLHGQQKHPPVLEQATMWTYYLFMAFLILTLVLWAIIALRDDTPKEKRKGKLPKGATPATGEEKRAP